MQWIYRYVDTAIALLENYSGNMPLQHYLKQHFALYKKYGSRDRKAITHLCYVYYRLGSALSELSIKERLFIALFLCSPELSYWQTVLPEHLRQAHNPILSERIQYIEHQYASFCVYDIFPFLSYCSSAIDVQAMTYSLLIQPQTFLRVRSNKTQIIHLLEQHHIGYNLSGDCIEVDNASKVSDILPLNRDVVVQDKSSQQVAEAFSAIPNKDDIQSLWDCCAASGGKSILAMDYLAVKRLLVSDVRASILKNLSVRFRQAGIQSYTALVADLSKPVFLSEKFHCIIADVPCSGSGTWARTPEELAFFKKEKIIHFQNLQKNIVDNVLPYLAEKGFFLYITCSIFEAENESNMQYIVEKHALHLIKTNYIKGYSHRADTMFYALFQK